MTTTSDILVLSLPEIVSTLNSKLEELTGINIPFVLVVADGEKALCSSNVYSPERELLLNRWRNQFAGLIHAKFVEDINKQYSD